MPPARKGYHRSIIRTFALLLIVSTAGAATLVLDVETRRVLFEDTAGTARAAPGSALKPFVAVALLETPTFRPAQRVACTRQLQINGRKLDCSHPALAMPVDLSAALAYSCNHYFATMSRRLDAARLAATLRRFGLNARVAGTADQLAMQAIGQWEMECTPAELAAAYRRLALFRRTAGVRYEPLWSGIEGAAEFGTAQLAKPAGLRVAGKTGTTQNRNRTGTLGWFAGWAPAGAPEFVVVVLTRGGGGPDAAPEARRAFERFAARGAH